MLCSWLDFQEFEGCQELRGRKAERGVDEANVSDFVRVGYVLAVPGSEHITAVKGSECQVVSVSSAAFQWHDLVAEIDGNNGIDLIRVGQAWQWIQQANHIGTLLVVWR